jgi:hypothetical protein
MTGTRKFVFSLGMSLLVALQACEKKKASLPPKMQAPTIAVDLPEEIPLAQVPEPTPQPEPAKATTQATNTKPKKPPRKATTSASAKKPNAQTTPSSAGQQSAPAGQMVASLQPPKTAEAVPETVVGAAVSNAQIVQLKEDTARMIESTENSLKGLNRSLSDDEKSMRSQIQSYLQQSRKATTDGDYERASLLAKKAQLLAEALVKK